MIPKVLAILVSSLFIIANVPIYEISDNNPRDIIANQSSPNVEIYSRIGNQWVDTNIVSNSGETNYFYHTTTLYCSSSSAVVCNFGTDNGYASTEGDIVGVACTDQQDNLIIATCVEFYQFESSAYPITNIYWSPEYTYCIPAESDTNTAVNNIVMNLVGIAVSAIGGLGASIAWTIGSSIISSNSDYNVDSSTYSSRWFEWSQGTDNVIQHVRYAARTNSNMISKYITEFSVIGYGIEVLSAGKQLHIITGIDAMPPHWDYCVTPNSSELEDIFRYSLCDSQISDDNELLISKALEFSSIQCVVSDSNCHFIIDLPSIEKLESNITNVEDLLLVIHERLGYLEKQVNLIKNTTCSDVYSEESCELKIIKLNELVDNLKLGTIDFELGYDQYFKIIHSGNK